MHADGNFALGCVHICFVECQHDHPLALKQPSLLVCAIDINTYEYPLP